MNAGDAPFYVRLDQALERGLSERLRTKAVIFYHMTPEEWELHPARWSGWKRTYPPRRNRAADFYSRMELLLILNQP